MKVMVDGRVAEIVDLAVDSQFGDLGFAVRYPSGQEELVCAGMVNAFNPVALDIPALGEVELKESGLPNVVALRGEKIPKYQQLSSILGVDIAWDPKNHIGFFVDDPAGPISLGYSFKDALRSGLRYTGQEITQSEFDRLVAQSDLLKWGALPGTVAGSFNPTEQEDYQRELARAYEEIAREEERRETAKELQEAYAAIMEEDNPRKYKPDPRQLELILPERLKEMERPNLPGKMAIYSGDEAINRFFKGNRRAFESAAGGVAESGEIPYFVFYNRPESKMVEKMAFFSTPTDRNKYIEHILKEGLWIGSESLRNIEKIGVELNPDLRFPAMPDREGMAIQSLIFPKDKFNRQEAKDWLKNHGFLYGKVDEKEATIRFRQLDPSKIEPNTWSTVPFGDSGIQAVVGIPLGGLFNPRYEDPRQVEFVFAPREVVEEFPVSSLYESIRNRFQKGIFEGLSKLEGTENQIKFAGDIRRKRLLDLRRQIETDVNLMGIHLKYPDKPVYISKDEVINAINYLDQMVGLVEALKEKKSAKFWIETKDKPADNLFDYIGKFNPRYEDPRQVEFVFAPREEHLVELKGTEKQVAWANKIREKMIDEMELAIKEGFERYKWELEQAKTDEEVERRKIALGKAAVARDKLIPLVRSIDSAKFWINVRDKYWPEVIREAQKIKKINPWGETTEGAKIFWARMAGPSQEERLSDAAGGRVKYYFPGEVGSPDPARGGYWLGDRYLGKSLGDAYSNLWGVPAKEIEQGMLTSDLGYLGSLSLSGGGNVLSAVLESGGNFDNFYSRLTENEALKLGDAVVSAGYPQGLQALHSQLSDTLKTWEEITYSPFAYNPPRYLEVVGKTGSIPLYAETRTGEIEGSTGYKGLGGLVIGPDLEYQRALSQDLQALQSRDFATPEQAWDQFYDVNSVIANQMYGTARAIDAAILEEHDASGNIFETITEHYERPKKLQSLEETIKYIVRKEKIGSWDQFPARFLRESLPAYADWLIFPGGSAKKEVALQLPEVSLGGIQSIERELDRSKSEASTRFRLLRSAYDILLYLDSRGLLDRGASTELARYLAQFTDQGSEFGFGEFEQFADYIQRSIVRDEPKEELPF